MHLAIQQGSQEIISLLIEAFKQWNKSESEKIKFLNLVDRWGYTCLDTAYDVGDANSIKILEQLGATRNLNNEMNSGKTITLNSEEKDKLDGIEMNMEININLDVGKTFNVLNSV